MRHPMVPDPDPFAALEAKHTAMIRDDAARAMARLQDGDALALGNTYSKLLEILIKHVGERGDSEGAVGVLERIVKERDAAFRALGHEIPNVRALRSESPTTSSSGSSVRSPGRRRRRG